MKFTAKSNQMNDITLDTVLSKSEYVSLDGPIQNVDHIAERLRTMGDLPKFYEEDQVRKALSDSGIDYDNLIKGGRRDIGNLVPVRRQMVSKNGRAYVKTVYVKREDLTDQKKSQRFLEQDTLENNLAVGDRVNARFKGWHSGTKYETDKVKVKEIKKDKIVLEFIENFDTNNSRSFTYAVGETITIPKSGSEDWTKDMSISRYQAPTPEPEEQQTTTSNQSAGEVVESIDQISVGDPVMVMQRGDEPDLPGEIKYIHPRGNFIDIQVGDKVKRRKLGRFKTVQSETSPQEMTMDRVLALSRLGVTVRTPGSSRVSREDRSRVVGQEEYQQRIRVDRFGQPNRRGRSWGSVTRTRPKYHQRTDEEMRQLMGNENQEALRNFNEKFGGFDFETYAAETKAAISQAFPDLSEEEKNIDIDIASSGRFSLAISNSKMRMTRIFDPTDKSVYHAYFTLNSSAQGTGIGKTLFKALYKQYKSAGIKKIKVSANIDVGGYAWGRYGFTAERYTAATYVRNFQSNVGRQRHGYTITQEDATRAKEAFDNYYANSENQGKRFPMNRLCSIGPDNKAGKAALLRTSWSGELNLEDTNQRVHFENYIGFSE